MAKIRDFTAVIMYDLRLKIFRLAGEKSFTSFEEAAHTQAHCQLRDYLEFRRETGGFLFFSLSQFGLVSPSRLIAERLFGRNPNYLSSNDS